MPRRWNERSELFASIESHQTDLAKIFQPSIDIGGTQQYEEHVAFRQRFSILPGTKSKIEETAARSLYQRGKKNTLKTSTFLFLNRSQRKLTYSESETSGEMFSEKVAKLLCFWFTLTAWIFSLKFPWCLLARQEIKIILLAFDVRLFKCEEIQDGEALEDERKARHEKLAAAKVLPVESLCFFSTNFLTLS